MLGDIRNFFEHEERDYYKPVRVNNFWNNNYIEYKSKSERKILSVKKFLDKISLYLKDLINNLSDHNMVACIRKLNTQR